MKNTISVIKRILALLAALALVSCAALAEAPSSSETADEALQMEEDDLSIYSEAKVQINPDDLAVTEGLDPNWRNILLAGSDARVSGSYGRTDAMLIFSINMKTRQAKLTSIMRDIWTPMEGRGPQKISAANVFGGPALAMRTVNQDFGMNITDYVLIDMEGVEHMIDLMGGIEVDLTEQEMWGLNDAWKRDDSGHIEPVTSYGEAVHLTGEQALAYARLRNIDNDYQRVGRQRTMLLAVARKAMEIGSGDLLDLIREGMNCVETDLSMTDVIQLAVMGLQIDLDGIEQFRLPVEGTYTTGYEDKLWVMWPDFEANAQQLHAFIYGE